MFAVSYYKAVQICGSNLVHWLQNSKMCCFEWDSRLFLKIRYKQPENFRTTGKKTLWSILVDSKQRNSRNLFYFRIHCLVLFLRIWWCHFEFVHSAIFSCKMQPTLIIQKMRLANWSHVLRPMRQTLKLYVQFALVCVFFFCCFCR